MASITSVAPNAPIPPTTPVAAHAHGGPGTRGPDRTTESSTTRGKFGRMFRNLPVFTLTDEDETIAQLSALAAKMVQPAEDDKPLGEPDEDENPDVPSGYTYLGQFIDHDITFDPVSSLRRENDPEALEDFRTPRFDLDSLYGRGPSDQPYLYRSDDPRKLRLGHEVGEHPFAGPDLPRLEAPEQRALIGDPRNDENLVVSQLQSTFLRFHNAVVDRVGSEHPGWPADDQFKEAQRLVRWHYQWIVINDFLRKHVVGHEVVDDILRQERFTISRLPASGSPANGDRANFTAREIALRRPRLMYFHWNERPFVPVEFAVAAYRFGHSMVRPSYFFNDFVRGRTAPARTKIFSANHDPNNLENLNGGRPLPPKWGFQWKYFFEVSDEANLPQPSYRIDDELVNPLGDLPDPPPPFDIRSLALRNLLRGVRLALPSGQAVSRAMGIPPLSEGELDLGDVAPAYVGNAPLWYYVLRESGVRAQGRRLGPVGARIVSEVLIGLAWGDPLSYLRVEPNWTPTLGPTPGHFSMPDLIRFTGAD